MIDSVSSYHADGLACGVTKFSQQLAKRLGVPFGGFHVTTGYPLLCWKPSEVSDQPIAWYAEQGPFDLFLHGPTDSTVLTRAGRVFAASGEIADAIRPIRPDVISAWCPSLVEAEIRQPITVLSMGMAHKLRTDLYATLKDELDATGEPYVVYVSAALHDGTTFSDASARFDALRRLFGSSFVFLGTLSDDALAERFRTCTYVAAFFEKGLRENNTSVMAALEAGATVLTNWDGGTPGALTNLTHDLAYGLPRHAQQRQLRRHYGWERLVELIRA